MKNSASSSSISSTASSATTGSTDSALRRSPRLAQKAAAAAVGSSATPEPPRVHVSIAYPVAVRSGRKYAGCIDQVLGLLVILVMAAFGYVLVRDLSSLK